MGKKTSVDSNRLQDLSSQRWNIFQILFFQLKIWIVQSEWNEMKIKRSDIFLLQHINDIWYMKCAFNKRFRFDLLSFDSFNVSVFLDHANVLYIPDTTINSSFVFWKTSFCNFALCEMKCNGKNKTRIPYDNKFENDK